MPKPEIVLVSTSIVRKHILNKLGFKVRVIKPEFKETKHGKIKPHVLACKNAISKLRSVNKMLKNRMAVSADTITVVGKMVLDKPKNKKDAERMLKILQKRQAKIITAVALKPANTNRIYVDFDIAICRLKNLSKKQQQRFLKSGRWRGIGGGYALKGFCIARIKDGISVKYKDPWVKMVKGKIDTVVGFSIRIFKQLLKFSQS